MGTSDSKGGFTVTDRRGAADQDAVGTKQPTAGSAEGEGAADRTAAAAAADEIGAHDASSSTLPAVDFHTFVLSLGSSALLHLGELEHPDGGPAEKDLPLAKHTIDILSMLEEKTKGNLTSAEEKLMQSLLFDLRLRFVNASK